MLSASSCRSFLRWKGCTTAVYLTTLQGTALGEQNGSPLSMGAVIKLVSTRRIEFLSLPKTGLSDIDGERLASALAASPRRDAKNSPGKERLDLTQIDFSLDVRDRLYKEDIAAGVEVFMTHEPA